MVDGNGEETRDGRITRVEALDRVKSIWALFARLSGWQTAPMRGSFLHLPGGTELSRDEGGQITVLSKGEKVILKPDGSILVGDTVILPEDTGIYRGYLNALEALASQALTLQSRPCVEDDDIAEVVESVRTLFQLKTRLKINN